MRVRRAKKQNNWDCFSKKKLPKNKVTYVELIPLKLIYLKYIKSFTPPILFPELKVNQ